MASKDRLSEAAIQARELESAARSILVQKGVITSEDAVPAVRTELQTIRESVAAVIVPTRYQDYSPRPLDIPVAMGIGGVKKDALEFIGGGLQSEEERQIIAAHSRNEKVDPEYLVDGEIPQHLYFLLLGKHLRENGELRQCHFDLREGMKNILDNELKREVAEEVGERASDLISLQEIFDAPPKETRLTTARFGSFNEEIAKRHADKGLRLREDGKLEGLYIAIRERGMLAVADLDKLIKHAEETEEVRGMEQISLGDLFERGKNATASVDSWNSYGRGKPRNDSVFYLVASFLEDWQKKLGQQ